MPLGCRSSGGPSGGARPGARPRCVGQPDELCVEGLLQDLQGRRVAPRPHLVGEAAQSVHWRQEMERGPRGTGRQAADRRLGVHGPGAPAEGSVLLGCHGPQPKGVQGAHGPLQRRAFLRRVDAVVHGSDPGHHGKLERRQHILFGDEGMVKK